MLGGVTRTLFWIRRINWSDGDLQEQEGRTVFLNARRFWTRVDFVSKMHERSAIFSKFCGGAASGGAAGGGAAGGGHGPPRAISMA